MTTQEQVFTLSTFVSRDDAGRHFTDLHSDAVLDELEAAGLVAITRPVHERTGAEYDRQYWTAEVTTAGVALVEAHPEYQSGTRDAAVTLARTLGVEDRAWFTAEWGAPPVFGPEFGDWDATAWTEAWRTIGLRLPVATDDMDTYQPARLAYLTALFASSDVA